MLNKIFILIVLTLFLSGCTNIIDKDFNVSNKWMINQDAFVTGNEPTPEIQISVISKNNLFYKIYDENNEITIEALPSNTPILIPINLSRIIIDPESQKYFDIYGKYLPLPEQIQKERRLREKYAKINENIILDVCVSTKKDFNKTKESVICKKTILSPILNFEITPNTLKFDLNLSHNETKNITFNGQIISSENIFIPYENLTITNKGLISTRICLKTPISYSLIFEDDNEAIGISSNDPQYVTKYNNCVILTPNNSINFVIGAIPGIDTQKKDYDTIAKIYCTINPNYIGLVYNYHEEKINLKTIVVN